jgi:hypothetical protein
VRRPVAAAAAAAALGGVILVRYLVRRRPAQKPEQLVRPDPRAEELRAKLAEARELAGEREEFEAGETPVDAPEPGEPLEDRRRRVHERGRAAAESMRPPPGDS